MNVATGVDPGARRATITTRVGLVAVAGVAWWATIHDARTTSSMVQGIATLDAPMRFDLAPLTFIRMWVTMMTAMMLPTTAPEVLRPAVPCQPGRSGVAVVG